MWALHIDEMVVSCGRTRARHELTENKKFRGSKKGGENVLATDEPARKNSVGKVN